MGKGEKQRRRGRLLLAHTTPCCPWPQRCLLSQSKKYVLMLVDPDAPSRANPRSRFWRHWLLTDVPVSVPSWEGGDIPTAAPNGAPFIPWVKSQRGAMRMAPGVWVGGALPETESSEAGIEILLLFPFLFPLYLVFFFFFLPFPKEIQQKECAVQTPHPQPYLCSVSPKLSSAYFGRGRGRKATVEVKILKGGGKKQQFWCKIPYFSPFWVRNPISFLWAMDGDPSAAALLPEGFGRIRALHSSSYLLKDAVFQL